MTTAYFGRVKQISFYDEGVNSNKFYRAYVLVNHQDDSDVRVLFQWGRRGTKGSGKLVLASTPPDGYTIADRKLREKEREGYANERPGDCDWTELDMVDSELLEMAGVKELSAPTSVDTPELARPVFAQFSADVDRCRRLAFGTPQEQTQAIAVRNDLRERLDFLRQEVTKADGQLDFVEDILQMAMEGVA